MTRKNESDRPDAEPPAAVDDWERVIRLAWRPAWSMRSRQGAMAGVWTLWRERWRLVRRQGRTGPVGRV